MIAHSTLTPPSTHPHPTQPLPLKAFHYVNLLQEEPQQHFYSIHQNRGKHVLEWFVMYCRLSGTEVWIQLRSPSKHIAKSISKQLDSKC